MNLQQNSTKKGIRNFLIQLKLQIHACKNILPPSLKICQLFLFSSFPINLSYFTFTIFGSGHHIPLIHSHSHFIIKLICKNRTYMPLTFLTHILLHFLKSMPGQMMTNYGGRREYYQHLKKISLLLVFQLKLKDANRSVY